MLDMNKRTIFDVAITPAKKESHPGLYHMALLKRRYIRAVAMWGFDHKISERYRVLIEWRQRTGK